MTKDHRHVMDELNRAVRAQQQHNYQYGETGHRQVGLNSDEQKLFDEEAERCEQARAENSRYQSNVVRLCVAGLVILAVLLFGVFYCARCSYGR
jgi:hypothetical protein